MKNKNHTIRLTCPHCDSKYWLTAHKPENYPTTSFQDLSQSEKIKYITYYIEPHLGYINRWPQIAAPSQPSIEPTFSQFAGDAKKLLPRAFRSPYMCFEGKTDAEVDDTIEAVATIFKNEIDTAIMNRQHVMIHTPLAVQVADTFVVKQEEFVITLRLISSEFRASL